MSTETDRVLVPDTPDVLALIGRTLGPSGHTTTSSGRPAAQALFRHYDRAAPA